MKFKTFIMSILAASLTAATGCSKNKDELTIAFTNNVNAESDPCG